MRATNQSYATGRRKTSCARVFLRPGKGQIIVNNLPLDRYFSRDTSRMLVCQPLVRLNISEQFDIYVTVCGGGMSGQAGAIRHGISHALVAYEIAGNLVDSPDGIGPWKRALRQAGFVTRDPRMVERKKVGLVKARKAKQFSKR